MMPVIWHKLCNHLCSLPFMPNLVAKNSSDGLTPQPFLSGGIRTHFLADHNLTNVLNYH